MASKYSSISYLQSTELLSDYDPTIYDNYINHIYHSMNLKNDLIYLNQNGIRDSKDGIVNYDISLRFMEPNPFQIAIFIWVIGFNCQELKQIFGSGIRVYLTIYSKFWK